MIIKHKKQKVRFSPVGKVSARVHNVRNSILGMRVFTMYFSGPVGPLFCAGQLADSFRKVENKYDMEVSYN